MQLSIVLSKAGEGEARIISNSSLDDIVRFFDLLGISGWDLYHKGTTRLEANGPYLYLAVGPSDPGDFREFLEKARSFIDI